MTLPKDLFQRAYKLLTPHVRTQDDQVALLTRAFYDQQWILDQIKFGGAAGTFATLCLKQLDDIGCSNGTHPAASLVGILRDDVGVEHAAEIEAISADVNDTCDDARSVSATDKLLRQPADVERQTASTPLTQRQPSVFVIYAEKDGAWVDQWLIPFLNKAGVSIWDGTLISGFDDDYKRLTQEGINNSYAVIVVLSEHLPAHGWGRKQVLWAREKRRPVFCVSHDDGPASHDVPFDLGGAPFFALGPAQHTDGIQALIAALPVPRLLDDTPGRERVITQRWLELLYLDYLRFERTLEADRVYTELAGATTEHRERRPYAFDELQQVYELQPQRHDAEPSSPRRRFEDAVSELLKLKRAVVLGEPGGGKSTTLEKLAAHLAEAALKDRTQPVPVLVRLGKWTRADQSLHEFVAGELGDLGQHLDTLLQTKRAAMLLDGLNEIPVEQRKDKTEEIAVWLLNNPEIVAILTCREQDYLIDLGLSQVVITPLDPLRIRDFARHHLGDVVGSELFYKLAGDGSRWEEEQFKTSYQTVLPAWERAFWLDDERPDAQDKRGIWRWHWEDWVAQRDAPTSLLVLARNPYMLRMLCDVYADGAGELPANRGALFGAFAARLLRRERIGDTQAQCVLSGLERVAWRMQERRAEAGVAADPVAGNAGSGDGALTVLIYMDAIQMASVDVLKQAASASLIEFGAVVRFSHQLLQEYFTARAMDARIRAGTLAATDIWPAARFWERTNWEEATVILAGLHSRDCSDIVNWVADANPEVAAQCVTRSGALVPDTTLLTLRGRWLPRLTDCVTYPKPHARANAGRALGLIRLSNGELLDNRRGVSAVNGRPDIDWVAILAGAFEYGDDDQSNNPRQRLVLDEFRISRFPITHAQFQCFIDAEDGWRNEAWWTGLNIGADDHAKPAEQSFKYWNHPRVNVSWFDAVAFCRWLSAQLGVAVTLPTEWQWERAVRGIDGKRYPWGNDYVGGYANINETSRVDGKLIGDYYLQSTSAVGLYPQGSSPEGLLDMSGNVLEWCLNEYGNPPKTQLEGDENRVLRGGSWSSNHYFARAACRYYSHPSSRFSNFGFG